MGLINRIKWYKRLFVATYFINIFLIVSGLVIGANYFIKLSGIQEDHKTTQAQINIIKEQQDSLVEKLKTTQEGSSELWGFYQALQEKEKNLSEQLNQKQMRMNDVTMAMFVIAILVLIFGLMIPYFIFQCFSQSMIRLKQELEKQVAHWVAEWIQAYQHHGGAESIKKIEFWTGIVLLTLEKVVSYGTHPVFQFFSEMIPLVRKQMNSSVQQEKN